MRSNTHIGKKGLDLGQWWAARGMNPRERGHIRSVMQNVMDSSRPNIRRSKFNYEWRLSLNQEFANGAIVGRRFPRIVLLVALSHLSCVIVMMMAPVAMIVRMSVCHPLGVSMGVAMITTVPNRVQAVAQDPCRPIGQQQKPGDYAESCVFAQESHRATIIHTPNTNGNRFANELQVMQSVAAFQQNASSHYQ
jgi:hypothetical protein